MKHVHMIGIGGSAMSPLAGMLQERGFLVTGSTRAYIRRLQISLKR